MPAQAAVYMWRLRHPHHNSSQEVVIETMISKTIVANPGAKTGTPEETALKRPQKKRLFRRSTQSR